MEIGLQKLKKTRQREQVFEILQKEKQPITVVEIYQQMQAQDQAISLSTIYRILNAFCKNQLVIKSGQLDNEQNFFELSREEHKHYAICLDCRKVIPIENCPLSSFKPTFSETFYPLEHKVEFYGHCQECHRLKNNRI